jgi:Spy/CpxP family protein refolding chaperone
MGTTLTGAGQQRSQSRGLTDEQVQQIFNYHEPSGSQVARMEQLRSHALQMANWIQANAPDSPERSLAIRSLQESLMWVGQSITINEQQQSRT